MTYLEQGPGSGAFGVPWQDRPPRGADSEPGLRERYSWYCARQVSMLLGLLPGGGVRELYKHAREWAAARAEHEAKDPMATLRRFCLELLPLPPFETWVGDFQAHPTAYLDDDLEPPRVQIRKDPVTVEVRSLVYQERPWQTELKLFSDGDVWRGFMVFHAGVGPGFSTAEVFCESSAQAIRERFLDFGADTLRAFLRSALP